MTKYCRETSKLRAILNVENVIIFEDKQRTIQGIKRPVLVQMSEPSTDDINELKKSPRTGGGRRGRRGRLNKTKDVGVIEL